MTIALLYIYIYYKVWFFPFCLLSNTSVKLTFNIFIFYYYANSLENVCIFSYFFQHHIRFRGPAPAMDSSSSLCSGLIHEMEQIISQLERGTLVTKFFPRKRPERKILMIRRETHQILWSRNHTAQRHFHEGCLELRDVKEVRLGKNSKDFERWLEESKKMDNPRCFVIIYGSDFKLRTLSVAGKWLLYVMYYRTSFAVWVFSLHIRLSLLPFDRRMIIEPYCWTFLFINSLSI